MATHASIRPSTSSTILLSPDDVLSKRHMPSWMLLALGAGAVNAGAFLACERFVTHVTGTASRIGLDVGTWWLVWDYALVLISFITGAMVSVLPIQARVYQNKRPLHAVPLFAVAAILAITAWMGHLGWFGQMGVPVEQATDFALLCMLAFAMGLMNASVASSTALSVRTTHMTGPSTDLGVHLATAWFVEGEQRHHALRLAALRGGKVLSFIAGAVLMFPLVHHAGYLAFMLPATLVLTAAILSFALVPHPTAQKLPQRSTNE